MFIPPYPYAPRAASDETIRRLDRDLSIIKWLGIAMTAIFLLVIFYLVVT